MRAFDTVWRACVSFYREMFTLIGVNIFWWLTGGVFFAAAVLLAWSGVVTGNIWVFVAAPLLAIPAGPAQAALADVARPTARDLRVNTSFYWEGFRPYGRLALLTSATSLVILSLLLLNLWFYWTRGGILQIFSFLWLYLVILWFGAQLYLYPVLVGLKQPTLGNILRTTAVVTLANPIYTTILSGLAVFLTGLSIVLAILLPLAWPAVIMLLGEHSFMLFMERMGITPGETTADRQDKI